MLRITVLVTVLGITFVINWLDWQPNSPEFEANPPTATPEIETPTTSQVTTNKDGTAIVPNSPQHLSLAPKTESQRSTENLPNCVHKDCNCSDFNSQKEAQIVLDTFPEDPHDLDRNSDGIACESLH
ncbi:MAG: excalibur calcium-binding domain-containing protein [Coleofasciculus sp. C2-GNP5-27]